MSPIAFGFGGPQDVLIIGVVVVLLFGSSKLSGWGKSLGDGIKEFKKATQDEDTVETRNLPPPTAPETVKSEDKHSV